MRQVRLVGRRLVVAGCGIRRGEDETPDARQSSGVEKAQSLGDVDVEGPERIADRVGDAGPGGEMDHAVDASNRARDRGPILERRADEIVGHAVEVGGLPDREVVEDPDPITPLDQETDERRADEAGAAGDQDDPGQRR